jgi:hypothetical protein
MMTQCECLMAGWCERHKINKSRMLHERCQFDRAFWDAWERGKGPKQHTETKERKLREPGPGDYLAKALHERGYKLRSGCGCEDKVAQMNRWGLAKCKREIDTIEAWLVAAAKKHAWAAKIALGLPMTREIVRGKIREIIESSLAQCEAGHPDAACPADPPQF